MSNTHLTENPGLDAKFAEIDAYVDCFDDYLTGFAALAAGLSVEEAKAAAPVSTTPNPSIVGGGEQDD